MVVDSLEISIQSDTEKINKGLDVLIGKLSIVAEGISAISTGKGFANFLKEVENISFSMADVSNSTKKMTDGIKTAVNSASGSMKQVEKSVDGVKKRLGDTLKEISDRTSDITPKLDMGNLDKEMSKYEKQLRDAGNLLNRILESSTADKQTAGIERLIIKINEAKNALKEIERIQNETSKVSTPEVNIPISTEETKRSLEDIVDELDEFFLAVRQNSDYKPFSAIQSSIEELKSKFPEATEEIKFFESELDKVYSQKYSVQSYGDVAKEVDKIEQEIFGAKEKAEELDNVFANIHPLEFKGDNFFEMEKWVDDLTNKLNTLLDRQEKMSTLGAKVDSKPMQSMAYDIEQLTKTLDVYEAKLEEARARGELDIKIPNIEAPIDKIVGKTKVLRDSVSDIKVSLSSPSLKQVERQIENIKKKYEDVVASIERGAANKDFFGTTPEFKRKTAELSAMRQKYQDLMQIQKELSLSGQTEDKGKADGKAKTQANSFQATVNAISKTAKNLERVVLNVKKHIDNLIRSIARLVSNGFKKLAGGIRSAVSNIAKFTGAIAKMIKENKKASKSFDFSFKTVLKYAFGIRSLFVLFNRLRSATKEGIDNLVKYSGQLNYSISIMTSALGALKNGFASAFAPIINVVAPYIAKFTNMMIDATNAIARFFSALTGHSTAIQAKKYYQDYAESLGGVTDEAKKAGKALHTLGIDELNILSETNKDKDELLPEDMFETVKITGDIADWAKELRKAFLDQDWEGLGRLIAELINKGLEWLYRKIKQITPKVERALKNLAKVINSFIKNLDWDLLGRTIGAGINLLTKAFNALFGDDGINLELLGEKLSVGLRGMIDEVDWRELGNAIGNYLMIAWRIAYGFIEDMWRIDPNTLLTGWAEAGIAIGETIAGIFERINFEQISAVITEGLKGVLETITYALNTFSDNLDWIVPKINIGLDRLYDGLKWDSTAGEDMGQKITAFTDAISNAFNKLLDLDFGKVGQVIGAAVADIVRAFNQLTDIDTGGLDFEKLGRKISDGLRKLVTEIPWEEFGNALGNGFMVAWRILDGFLTDMAKKSNAGLAGWQEIGKAIADTINGLFDKFDLGKIANTISRLVNGIFEMLKQAVENIRWDDIADNLARGINGLIDGIKWKENGKAFNDLLTELLGMLLKAAEDVEWEELGHGIAEFLQQIDWGKHLATVAKIIMEVLGGLLEGLGETPAGKVVAGLIKAFLALKLVSKLAPIASHIANALGKVFEHKVIENSVQKGLEKALENSVGGVKISSGLSGKLTALGNLIGDGIVAATGAYIGLSLAEKTKPAIDEMKKNLGYNPIEIDAISEEYGGKSGSLKLLYDQTIGRLTAQFQGLPNAVTNSVQSMDALEKAMKAIGKGTIYTDKQLEKMQKTWGLTNEDVEMLRQAMLDANPVLREVADTMGMYDDSAESIKNAAVQMGLMKDSAFDLKDLGNRLSDFTFRDLVTPFWNNVKSAWENKDWKSLGANAVLGLVAGFLGAIMAPFDAAADLFGWIWDGICEVFGIHSPAENMKPLGRNILLGIVEGFRENFAAFGEAISDWWNNHVKPWFTKERWVELYDTIRLSFDEVWGNLRALWQNTNFSEWINNHVTPWFTKEKWLEIYDNIKISFEEKWNALREWWSTTTFAEWIDNHVTPWFNKETWLETYDSFRSSFEEKWAQLQAWWENTNFSEWIDNYVTPWFTKERWLEIYHTVKSGLEETWQGLREWWQKTTFKEWIDGHVKPFFNLEDWKTTYHSVKQGLVDKWSELREWWQTTNFSEWINNHVKPYFKLEDWKETYHTVKQGLTDKWEELRAWWKNTDFSEWIDNHVKPHFTLDKWKGYYDAVKSGFESKWNDLTKWWETDGIKKFFDDHVKKWFSKETWTWDGIKEGLGESFSSAFDWIKELWNGFAIPINSLLKFEIKPINIMGKEIFGGATIDLGQLPTFSTGGFPEDGLFMANHTELVGHFANGRTAVANNDQIIAGIEEAAYRGFLRAQAETSSYLADIAENTRRTAEKDPPQLVLEGRETVEWIRSWDDRSGYNMRR